MKYAPSAETSYAILAVIVDNKEFAQYDMPKAVGKDYRTVIRHLHDLERLELVKFRTEAAMKGGKDRKIYSLTHKGLLFLLKTFLAIADSAQEVEKGLDVFAENHQELLPLVFGKWQFYAEHGVKDLIVQ